MNGETQAATDAVPIRQFQYRMPKGEEGVMESLSRMGEVIWHCSHSTRLAAFARELIENAGVAAYDGKGEIKALFDWVQQNIRYTRDPYGYEWIQSVVPTLVFGHGDCDCHTVLLGSLLMSVGYPVRLVIVGNSPGSFFHVFLSTEYRGPGGIPVQIVLDSTLPNGEGFDAQPQFPVRRDFQILPQGKLKEVPSMNSVSLSGARSYGLGDYLGDLGVPSYTVTFHLSSGQKVVLPWKAHDLNYVSDNERRAWILKEIVDSGKYSPEEIAELIGVVERMDEVPEVQALGLGDTNLGGFWKKLGKGLKSGLKAVGKGLKTAVSSIPIIGKPIVGIARGLKEIVKAPFTGVKAALQEDKKEAFARATSLLKPGQIATTPEGAPLYSKDGGKTFVLADGTPYPDGHPVMILPGAVSKGSSEAEGAESPEPKTARVEIAPGEAQAVPEVKAEGNKKLLLAAGGAAAVGGGAYLYTRSR